MAQIHCIEGTSAEGADFSTMDSHYALSALRLNESFNAGLCPELLDFRAVGAVIKSA
jgi:hypothetical protein